MSEYDYWIDFAAVATAVKMESLWRREVTGDFTHDGCYCNKWHPCNHGLQWTHVKLEYLALNVLYAWEILLNTSQLKCKFTKYAFKFMFDNEKMNLLWFASLAQVGNRSTHLSTKTRFPTWPLCYWNIQSRPEGKQSNMKHTERFDSYMKTGTSQTLLWHLQLLKFTLNIF